MDYINYSILADKDQTGYEQYPDPESFFAVEYIIPYIIGIHKSYGDPYLDDMFFRVTRRRFYLSVLCYLSQLRKEKVSDKKKNAWKKKNEGGAYKRTSLEHYRQCLEKEVKDLETSIENVWEDDMNDELGKDITNTNEIINELNKENSKKLCR